jgi:hypothetical protein
LRALACRWLSLHRARSVEHLHYRAPIVVLTPHKVGERDVGGPARSKFSVEFIARSYVNDDRTVTSSVSKNGLKLAKIVKAKCVRPIVC